MNMLSSFKPAILAAALCLAGAAHAADFSSDYTPPLSEGGFYVRGDLGGSWLDWKGKDDGGFAWGGGLGYDYGNGVRTDLRLERDGTFKTGDALVPQNFDTTTVLLNGYYDFQVSEIASPYLGAGIGWGKATSGKSGDDDGFTYAGMAGLNLRLADSLVGDVGYRYRDINLSGDDLTDHSVLAGVRFGF